MIITAPIYFVRIEGDLKHIVCELPDVIIATYEENLNKTFVVLKATNNNYTKEVIKYFYNLHEDSKKRRKKNRLK